MLIAFIGVTSAQSTMTETANGFDFLSLTTLFSALFGCAMIAQKKYMIALLVAVTVFLQINNS
jgi:hypothetical protein